MGADQSKKSDTTPTSTDKYMPAKVDGRRKTVPDSSTDRQVTAELHHFLAESQLIGMEKKLMAAKITSMKKLLDADEEDLNAYGITPVMVHRLTIKLKKYITKHPEVENDESNINTANTNARSQSLLMDGFPSIVQRMATANRPLSDTSINPADTRSLNNRSLSDSFIGTTRQVQIAPSLSESIQEDNTGDNFNNSDGINRSATNNSSTEANIRIDVMNSSDNHIGGTVDEHSTNLDQQSSLAASAFVNTIEDSPVATRDSLRRIGSVPASDSFHDSLQQLSLDNTPTQLSRSPSLPHTGTMLLRQQQDQQMATLLSSVSAVLRLLKNSGEISELMTAAQSLSMLCGKVSNRRHAISCGAIEVLAEAIPKAYDDIKLLEEYCRSLKYLMHKVHLLSSTPSLVVIPVLLDVLKRFVENDAIIVQVLITLASYGRTGVEARQVISTNNGIQVTLIAMEIGSRDAQIQSCGLALLACTIVEMPALKEELCRSCDAIVRHMQDFEEHAMVQLYGCAVFAAMTADFPSLSSQLALAGVIGVLSEVMRAHNSDNSVLLWAIKALANMTVDEERCGDILVEGGVGQITIAMKTFKQSSGIQTWGAYALCRILYCNKYCLQAVLKHGVELVLQQRYFHDDEAGMYLTKLESLLVELQLSS